MSSLLHAILEVVLFACLVYGAVKIFAGVMSAAFPDLGASSRPARGGRGKALRSPAPRAARTAGRSAVAAAAHPGNRQIRAQARADTRRLWEAAKSANWLEQRRHERAHGTATATGSPPRRRLGRLLPFRRASAGGNGRNGNPGGVNGQPAGTGNGAGPKPGTCSACGRPVDADGMCTGCLWEPAYCHCPHATGAPNGRQEPPNGRQRDPGPRRDQPEPAQPSSNGGENVPAGTSTASAEKLIEGINEIYAHAAAGGIHAKQEAIKAAHEACVRFAAMSQMLARTMAEPGSNYGQEITEPCSKAGQHLQAAAMAYSEADAALSTLINMTVGDLANSPRQAPHHRELSETGAH